MTDKPTTLLESFQTMDGTTIRKIILEAQSFLKNLEETTLINIMKRGVGLDLGLDVMVPSDEPEIVFLAIIREDDWNKIGKFITSVGILLDKAGIASDIQVRITTHGGNLLEVKLKMMSSRVQTFFEELEDDCKDDLGFSVEGVLEFMEPTDDTITE